LKRIVVAPSRRAQALRRLQTQVATTEVRLDQELWLDRADTAGMATTQTTDIPAGLHSQLLSNSCQCISSKDFFAQTGWSLMSAWMLARLIIVMLEFDVLVCCSCDFCANCCPCDADDTAAISSPEQAFRKLPINYAPETRFTVSLSIPTNHH
jgi:hypothetical protein